MKTTQNASRVRFLHLVAYSSLSDRGVHVTKLPNPSIAYVYKCFSDVHEVFPVEGMLAWNLLFFLATWRSGEGWNEQ
jgi:hypothetical protein